MGQRLNIQIEADGIILANAYYHWAAYTSSSLELVSTILGNLDDIKHEDPVYRAVKLLESSREGAGLTESELEYMKNNIFGVDYSDINICQSRNDGMIAVSKEGIENTIEYQESVATIDLTKEIVNFDVLDVISKEAHEYNVVNKYTDIKYDDLKIYDQDIDVESIPFDKFNHFFEFVKSFNDYNFRIKGSESVIDVIE